MIKLSAIFLMAISASSCLSQTKSMEKEEFPVKKTEEEWRAELSPEEYNILREKGYNIARRTVAKYREQLNVPVARLRKEL